MISLGIDTSNYTTSIALFDSSKGEYISRKIPLPVKKGEKGLRQSDAVFHHTVQLPELISELFKDCNKKPDCIGVSVSPRDIKGSYMPCFLVGKSVAESISSVFGIPMHSFSHQQGHIASVLYSTNNTELFNEKFIAFHVSGGTTEAVLVTPDSEKIIKTEQVFYSSDLNAGQVIDRVGLMLNLSFPCGPELDKLSLKSDRHFNIRPAVRDNTFSFSGLENKCKALIDSGEKNEDTAKFCIEYILYSLEKAVDYLTEKYGNLPVVFSGGVMSNTIIRNYFTEKYNGIFTTAEFSSDNALGISVLSALKEKKNVG